MSFFVENPPVSHHKLNSPKLARRRKPSIIDPKQKQRQGLLNYSHGMFKIDQDKVNPF